MPPFRSRWGIDLRRRQGLAGRLGSERRQDAAHGADARRQRITIALDNVVRFAHAVLGACFAAAVRKGLLVSNPVARAEPPAPGDQNAGQVLDQEQLAALLNGFRGTTLYPIVATAAFTRARRNEILALRWADVNLADKTLTIGRALELTKAHGRRFEEPKTRRGRRTHRN